MNNLLQHFGSISKKLISEYNISKSSTHSGIKGSAREIFVRDFLAEHLPKKAIITSGQIFDSEMRTSCQQDLVLYHGDIPIIHLDGTNNLLFIEGVLAVIEVKSKLTKKEYYKSIDNYKKLWLLKKNFAATLIRSDALKILEKTSFYIFAYDGPDDKILAKWSKAYKDKLAVPQDWEHKYRPDCICVLDKYAFIAGDTILAKQIGNSPLLDKHSLFFFFFCLAATIPPFLTLDVSWLRYINDSFKLNAEKK